MIGGTKVINSYATEAKQLLCLCFSIVILVLSSCQKDELSDNLPLRTVIVYMIADNNLDYFSVKDINEMEAGFDNGFNGNMIVYADRAEGATPSHPIVYKISKDTTETISSEITFVYGEQNSANGAVMFSVLSDIINKYPAQSYGLILWSHGTAWYPEGTKISEVKNTFLGNSLKQLPLTKSFGRDGKGELNIKELKSSLPVHFDFIIFDACYMGSIEVAYELKDNANYILSSATEVLSAGYPYKQITGELFEQNVNYKKVANDFFISYDTLSNALKSATVSIIKTSKLRGLANQVSLIMNDTNNLKQVNISEIQQYTVNKANFLFDVEDFMCNSTTNSKTLEDFKRTLNEVVIFKASTQTILDELEIKSFSGLSIYVPDSSNYKYYDYYKTLDWYKDCGYYNYFNMLNISK
ncbi:MAG: hypothetical protein IPM71_16270 [Bacteroidota bacterium]|nr:MAG: hypothetical protein IPM71_16270 [Bacteroidota bacterium]